jgi:hypothetical protein
MCNSPTHSELLQRLRTIVVVAAEACRAASTSCCLVLQAHNHSNGRSSRSNMSVLNRCFHGYILAAQKQ